MHLLKQTSDSLSNIHHGNLSLWKHGLLKLFIVTNTFHYREKKKLYAISMLQHSSSSLSLSKHLSFPTQEEYIPFMPTLNGCAISEQAILMNGSNVPLISGTKKNLKQKKAIR